MTVCLCVCAHEKKGRWLQPFRILPISPVFFPSFSLALFSFHDKKPSIFFVLAYSLIIIVLLKPLHLILSYQTQYQEGSNYSHALFLLKATHGFIPRSRCLFLRRARRLSLPTEEEERQEGEGADGQHAVRGGAGAPPARVPVRHVPRRHGGKLQRGGALLQGAAGGGEPQGLSRGREGRRLRAADGVPGPRHLRLPLLLHPPRHHGGRAPDGAGLRRRQLRAARLLRHGQAAPGRGEGPDGVPRHRGDRHLQLQLRDGGDPRLVLRLPRRLPRRRRVQLLPRRGGLPSLARPLLDVQAQRHGRPRAPAQGHRREGQRTEAEAPLRRGGGALQELRRLRRPQEHHPALPKVQVPTHPRGQLRLRRRGQDGPRHARALRLPHVRGGRLHWQHERRPRRGRRLLLRRPQHGGFPAHGLDRLRLLRVAAALRDRVRLQGARHHDGGRPLREEPERKHEAGPRHPARRQVRRREDRTAGVRGGRVADHHAGRERGLRAAEG
ncbi:serine palmitoyltransferase [Strigomonas culicis]|uniref:Serine palmitoyltransferase n=1 Tax=Strigomonas culicis TaxID=28005 RepID=S9VVG9_9TRYP|nr:serine palmitoyltransferase [Strigomonas culicis]|eukprot:EPY27320.1 serine palmitoyltransferase [Strigomonas culicis]